MILTISTIIYQHSQASRRLSTGHTQQTCYIPYVTFFAQNTGITAMHASGPQSCLQPPVQSSTDRVAAAGTGAQAQDAQAAGLVAMKRPHFCAPPATRSSLSCQPPTIAS